MPPASNTDTRTFKQRKNFGKYFPFVKNKSNNSSLFQQHEKKKWPVFETNFQIVNLLVVFIRNYSFRLQSFRNSSHCRTISQRKRPTDSR